MASSSRKAGNLRAQERGGKTASIARAVAIAAGLVLGAADTYAQITAANWGSLTEPVFGSSEAGAYAGAELFAGPNKFGSYFFGVLPNGRIVRPAGVVAQIGMNPLGCVLTPDGKFLVTSNDDERESGAAFASLINGTNQGSYSLSVLDTSTMTVVSQTSMFQTPAVGRFFIGMQVTGTGPYKLWASGGPDNNVKVFAISAAGVISASPTTTITVPAITPKNAGFVSHYEVSASFPPSSGFGPPAGFNYAGVSTSFPAGSALSPDGRFLYVACNGDNSLAVIDTVSNSVVRQVPVGYFPYAVAVGKDGSQVAVSNWGVTEYKFFAPTYDADGKLTGLGTTGDNLPASFSVPPTSTGPDAKTSSISILRAPGGDGSALSPVESIYQGEPLDALNQVGDTHPSAMAIVRKGNGVMEVLYVAKANSDSLGVIQLQNNHRLKDVDLSPVGLTLADSHQVHGAYPNAIVVSPDNERMYVAEAGINSVAVLDTHNPVQPKVIGRIPTGWYPTGLAISGDGRYLYVVNAKGVGEDINPNTDKVGNPHATGVESFTDGNFIFGTAQRIDLSNVSIDNSAVLANNFAVHAPTDTSVVPEGGSASSKIKHVIFVLHENKTFDSVLGTLTGRFGAFASTTFNSRAGGAEIDTQFTPVTPNIQTLANAFSTAVNYYSDSEESDAGHQFCMSGTASDYTEKTLLLKGPNNGARQGRGLLVNKNFEPEDYPEGGYIFNNAARNGVSFKIFGIEAARMIGTDTGGSKPAKNDDPPSGKAGYPQLPLTYPVTNVPMSDVDSATQGVGHSFFMTMPALGVLGANNSNGEPRIDVNYPGYNFNISDQRRALEFIKDFDNMVKNGTLPQFIYLYQPSDHTGTPFTATNVPQPTGPQQVADGDVGLGMAIQHIMKSPIYYDQATDTGSAIFITFDDAQSTRDHIHEHRTPLVVVSPFAKPAFTANRHYVTASIVKTEELLLGLPPNNLGDLFATDLRDMFQPNYNGITAASLSFTRVARYTPSPEGRRIWALAGKLDTSGPDRDSRRLGALNHLSMQADRLHAQAVRKHQLKGRQYQSAQAELYRAALKVVRTPAPRDSDG